MRLIRNLFILESYRDNHNGLHMESAVIIAVQDKRIANGSQILIPGSYHDYKKEDVQQ